MIVSRNKRKIKIGWVVSHKMNKTIVVAVHRLVRNARYQKVQKKTTKLYAHDENNQCQLGDKVKITETRPWSKLKRWRLVEILEKGRGVKEELKEELE